MGNDLSLHKMTHAKRKCQNGCTKSGCDEELSAPADDGIQKGSEG